MQTQPIPATWQRAFARAETWMDHRTQVLYVTDRHLETEGTTYHFNVDSAVRDDRRYGVAVNEFYGRLRVRCTCPAHEHGMVCWHTAAALIVLGWAPPSEEN